MGPPAAPSLDPQAHNVAEGEPASPSRQGQGPNRKPYLGGYRHKKTGVIYLHAATQTTTAMEKRAMLCGPRFHRDVQTIFTRHRFSQSTSENGTQMNRADLFKSTENDYVIHPKLYKTAAERHHEIVQAVIVLQCFFRKIKAIRRVRHIRTLREEKIRADELARQRHLELTERQRRKEIQRRVRPRALKDFALLYSGLENWRSQEAKKIQSSDLSVEDKQQKLAELLNQEATLIQQIETLKVEAQEEAHEKATNRWIDKMAGSKKWPLSKGGHVLVDTPTTLRARELRDLYYTLVNTPNSVDARLHILLQVKNAVKEHDCTLSQDLIQLINREGDLLCRGRDGDCLDGLRQRISFLFLQFISVPEFNPEAALTANLSSQAKLAAQKSSQAQFVYVCKSCNKYLPSTSFHLSTTSDNVGVCHACVEQKNAGSKRQCTDEYVRMLAAIRLSEAALTQTSVPGHLPPTIDADAILAAAAGHGGTTVSPTKELACVLVSHYMTEDDVAHLVEVVWNGHSAVSGNRAMHQLVLVRWDPAAPLAPWNAILLTADEAHTHATVDRAKLYSREFVTKVQARLAMTRKKWARLAALEEKLNGEPHARYGLQAKDVAALRSQIGLVDEPTEVGEVRVVSKSSVAV
ncbi:hypothetical protein AMAG_06055 [Allomyces macrogynus ATCC 38327]|uniref:IQ motif and ubiquitin-like domain-containing protein n=1 Tax=Allomyces macrogynus (strain ATCC 38327) TaxID=578462 RepID=A0A0L0SE31_ALLM3|nr:hypothetical protein AMAG_06055 [Allomyces macrogynus ATCC 38327]|eukprot:KNE60692.1 hypothetical protein AMAG_06055 [Allomyces macrogynus ATCC 38327]